MDSLLSVIVFALLNAISLIVSIVALTVALQTQNRDKNSNVTIEQTSLIDQAFQLSDTPGAPAESVQAFEAVHIDLDDESEYWREVAEKRRQ